ncbi:MAG TPA: DUF4340 domain-containing protein [Burkholderiales bacterium]|nr:DUF4340 domain-containing protein [Burkholderiales bacterium]
MRAWLSIAALAVAVAALGYWVYSRPEAPSEYAHALSSLAAKDVQRIRLERPASAPASAPVAVLIERRDDAWRITEPFSARADTFQVGRLLAILDARSSTRFPATELSRYGLDAPRARLTLNDERVSYGAVNTMTREQYVHAGDAVYAVPLAQRLALPRDANALISRALLAANEVPTRLELPELKATLAEGQWKIEPSAAETSPDERNAWIDAWRNATAVQAVRYDGPAHTAEITIATKEGPSIALAILQREPELVLLRMDEGIAYHFFADAGRRLLSPPATPAERANK